jgi:hypothetical protein
MKVLLSVPLGAIAVLLHASIFPEAPADFDNKIQAPCFKEVL